VVRLVCITVASALSHILTLLLVMLALSRLVNASLMRQMQQLALPQFQFHCFKISCVFTLYLDVNKSDSEVYGMLHTSVR